MAWDNELKEIDIKNCPYYCFDDMMNINNFNPINIDVDNKSCTDFIYDTGYETSDGVKPFYNNFNEINEFIIMNI